MKKEELAKGIDLVEDRLIAEAENEKNEKREEIHQNEEGILNKRKEKKKILKKYTVWGMTIAAAFFFILFVSSRQPDHLENGGEESDMGDSNGSVFEKRDYQKKAVALASFPEGYEKEEMEIQKQIQKENPIEVSFYESLQKFSFQTTSVLLKQEEPEPAEVPNFLYSPLSLYEALAVTAQGAAGETREELYRLLNVSDTWDLAEQCGNLYRRLYQNNESGVFQLANSLWMEETIHWKKDYLDVATKDFYASLFSVNFGEDATYRYMGEWVADQTNGLLAPEFQANGRQIFGILNTVYLKDRWKDSFYEEFTKENPFYLADGTTISVPFMNKEDFGEYFIGNGFIRASLELEQIGSMVFVLPEEGTSIEELLATPERIEEAFTGGSLVSGGRRWQIPKFTYERTQDMKPLLKELGIKTAFESGKADFSNLMEHTEELLPWISEVRQGSRLIVEEGGIEAAAYTYVGMEESGGASAEEEGELILNRPFLYGIVQDGVYLFLGVCGNPAVES